VHGLRLPKSRIALELIIKISSFVAGLICLVISLPTYAEPSLDTMTVEQKIGQIMIWSFSGTGLTPETQKILTKYQPGAFVVFRRNIHSSAAISKLLHQLQTQAAARKMPPLFFMVDQEGGLVTRVRTTTPMPSALALAKMEDPEFLTEYGHATADVLALLGFNVDLAPVLDISNPKRDSFIGNRAFGDDPEQVAELTKAYAQGVHEGGLLPTAKHFPGHGGTLTDSHHSVPRKLSTLEQLRAHDLVPFKEFVSTEIPKAVMIAHLALPNVDSSGLPATYSSKLIQGQLRQELGYNGLVITDDLEMGGASISKDIGERATRAFLAGNDMLMFAGSAAHQRAAFDALFSAVKHGRISTQRLDESVARILEAKNSMPAPLTPEAKAIGDAFNKLNELSKQVMKHAFDVAAEESGERWPHLGTRARVLVFSANTQFSKTFAATFKGRSRNFVLNPTTLNDVSAALQSTRADFAVYFASGSQTAHRLNRLTPELRQKLIVINCTHPGEIEHQDDYLGVLNLNSYFPGSAAWLADLLNDSGNDLREPAADEESNENQ
jgi:beta-N-acetylhexosaminidase